jgi:hypothetical protein
MNISSKTPIESYIDRFGMNRLACNMKQALRTPTCSHIKAGSTTASAREALKHHPSSNTVKTSR